MVAQQIASTVFLKRCEPLGGRVVARVDDQLYLDFRIPGQVLDLLRAGLKVGPEICEVARDERILAGNVYRKLRGDRFGSGADDALGARRAA